MERTSDMLLVVHVPKTAGTSFRQALEQYFGVDKVVRDYGPNAKETTEVVRNYLYNTEKPKSSGELVQAISDDSNKVLIGHFPVGKYANYFEPKNIIGFVRDPLTRTCSEYIHRLRNSSFEGSFSDFMRKSSVKNIQTRFLNGISEESIIGVTEEYCDSLVYINAYFQFKLSPLKRNVDKKGGGQKLVEKLTKDELDLFHNLNQKDIALYKRANQRFCALDIPKQTGKRFVDWFNSR